jgi:hypothetical protein
MGTLKNNISTYIREIEWGCGLHLCRSEHRQVVGSCDHCNDALISITCEELFDKLKNYKLLEKDSVR